MIQRLAPASTDKHFGILAFGKFVIFSVHLDLKAGGRDAILKGEIGDVSIEINRPRARAPQFQLVLAVGEALALQEEGVVETEEIVLGDGDFLLQFTVEQDFDGHVGEIFPGGLDVIGHGFDTQRGVARGCPPRGVLAVIEEEFGQTGGLIAGRFDAAEQFQIVRMGFKFTAIPPPPVASVAQIEMGGLVLGVLDQKLFDVLQHFIALSLALLFVVGKTDEAFAVNGEAVFVAEQEIAHLLIHNFSIREHHVDKRVRVVRLGFHIGIVAFDLLHFPLLIGFQPGQSAFQNVRQQGQASLPGRLQSVDHGGGRVRIRSLALAGKPSPAPIAVLHVGKFLQTVANQGAVFSIVENAIADPLVFLPLLGPILGDANFLGVEIHPLFLDGLEVEAHVEQHFVSDDHGNEPIQRLLRAAVGVID